MVKSIINTIDLCYIIIVCIIIKKLKNNVTFFPYTYVIYWFIRFDISLTIYIEWILLYHNILYFVLILIYKYKYRLVHNTNILEIYKIENYLYPVNSKLIHYLYYYIFKFERNIYDWIYDFLIQVFI